MVSAPLGHPLAVRAVDVIGIDDVNPVFVHSMHRLPEVPVILRVSVLGKAVGLDALG